MVVQCDGHDVSGIPTIKLIAAREARILLRRRKKKGKGSKRQDERYNEGYNATRAFIT
jgi:hypothetical protein